ncbi:MAG: WD40 repeat domain-containing protein, partial [Bacteroidota bacterium]
MPKNIIQLIVFSLLSSGLFAQDQSLLMNLKGHQYPIQSLAFSPDEQYLVSGGGSGAKGELILWDIKTGQMYYKYNDFWGPVEQVKFSSDGRYFLAVAKEKLFMYEVRNGQPATSFFTQSIRDIAFSQKSNLVLAQTQSDQALLIDPNNWGQARKRFMDPNLFIEDIAFSPDGTRVCLAGYNPRTGKGKVTLWDTRTGYLLYNLGDLGAAHPESVKSVDFDPNGRYLVSGAQDGTFKIWELSQGRLHKDLSQPYSNIEELAYSPDGNYIATVGQNKTLQLWNSNSGEKFATHRGHFKVLSALAYSGKGKFLASGGDDLTVKLWRAIPFKQIIEQYVQDKVRTWQKRGKFEKTAD